MNAPTIRFDNGAAYEEFMGKWSRLAGDAFLRWLDPERGWRWVDVGCGNGAFTQELVDRCAPLGVTGIDPSAEQVEYARQRLAAGAVNFDVGDAMALPYADNVFRATTMAFGGRNVPDLTGAFREMNRVMAPGGRAVFLELNRPRMFGFKQLFDFYFHTFSPLIGGLVSGDREAYSYLPRSVDHFESVGDIAACMRDAGMRDIEVYRLMFGVAVVHVGTKPATAQTS